MMYSNFHRSSFQGCSAERRKRRAEVHRPRQFAQSPGWLLPISTRGLRQLHICEYQTCRQSLQHDSAPF